MNPNIIFIRADKGITTVALNKDFYIKEIDEVLNDQYTYTKINKNPSKKIKKKTLNTMLKS